MNDVLTWILAVAVVILAAAVVYLLFSKKNGSSGGISEKALSDALYKNNQALRQEMQKTTQQSISSMGNMLSVNQQNFSAAQTEKLMQLEQRLGTFSSDNQQKLEQIRQTVEKRLEFIRDENSQKLEQMRATVDEKLQKTLEEKMTRSFSLVTERLEQVYKGLGEMQNLAAGVGDLKKVLSNVKTRGILGELQLSAILKEILSPEQYCENVVTVPKSKNPVEFAVKLPAEDNSFIYLPIDSKFPGDTYTALVDAYEQGDKAKIDEVAKALVSRLKSEAKDIHEKYVCPPYTTDFAILFLPFEGLYAEAVNRGMVEILQREYKINLAGPSTMAALLNSLQMGFKTLAVQKRSAQVWEVLSSVKGEFDKFSTVLENTQQRLEQANNELDKLVGVRTRQIQRKLEKLQSDSTDSQI